MAEVDIVVPVYKGRLWVAETIESLRAQTFRDWRLVVVDDECPENTGELVERLDPGALVLRQERNTGPGRARQRAVSATTAKFVAFCDQDDLWHPTKLERQIATMDGKVAACHTNFFVIDESGVVVGEEPHPQPDWVHDSASTLLRAHYQRNRIKNASVLIRRDAWDETGGYTRGGGGEDWSFWFDFIARGHALGYLPERLLFKRRHHDNTSSNAARVNELRRTKRAYAIRYARQLGPAIAVRALLGRP